MALGAPFDLVGNGEVGVVCIHGFTGTPYEMRFLGEQLAAAGFGALGLLLPGHGTSVADLARTPWQAWADAVAAACDAMAARHRRVAVVGESLGGLLALHAAAHRPELAAVATLAAPLWLDGLAGRFARWAAAGRIDWLGALPKLGGADVRDRAVKRDAPGYRALPVRGIAELAAFMDVVRDELPRVRQPVLVVHGRHDHTAPVACAREIAARTRAVRTRILERSYHLIALDVERDVVAAEVIAFLRRHAGVAAGDLACAT